MKYSIVVPAYNEAENLKPLFKKLNQVFNNSDVEYVLINDGSIDQTLEVAKELQKTHKNLKLLSFKKNLGKSYALAAGFFETSGSVVITLDADLQDDPAEAVNLASEIDDLTDVVVGWRKDRQDNLVKKISSRIFNLFVAKTTGLELHDLNCGLKVYKQEVIKTIGLADGMHRFIPLLAHLQGYQVKEKPVNHSQRTRGKSKYGKLGLKRSIKGFLDLLTIVVLQKYAMRPMRLFGSLGMIMGFIGSAMGFYLVYLRLDGQKIGDRPLLILSILLIITGVQFFTLGFLGELFSKKNSESLPPYITYE